MIAPRWRFWLLTVTAVLAILLTLSLGRWQLNRAAEKVARQEHLDSQGKLPAMDNATLLTLPNPLVELHRPIRLTGQWVADQTVYLDNRQMNAKPGMYVVTPFKVNDSSAVVLVQRGWVPRNFEDRTQVPVVRTPSGAVTLEGRIAPPPAKLYELGGPETGMIRQNLDLPEFSIETGLPLLPMSVQQIGAPSDGLLREWPVVGTGVEKHYGYAFQWFALSTLIALLYVWFQIVRRFFPSQRT